MQQMQQMQPQQMQQMQPQQMQQMQPQQPQQPPQMQPPPQQMQPQPQPPPQQMQPQNTVETLNNILLEDSDEDPYMEDFNVKSHDLTEDEINKINHQLDELI